jgi:hypothetical protein
MPKSKTQRWYDQLSKDDKAILQALALISVVLIIVAIITNPLVSITVLVLIAVIGFTIYFKIKTGKWWFRTHPSEQPPKLPREKPSITDARRTSPLPNSEQGSRSVTEVPIQASPATPNPAKSSPQAFGQLAIDQQVDIIAIAIQNFIPPRRPPNEIAYQDMLVSSLKRDFPEILLRQQFGNNEIDVLIGRIGIEAKLGLKKSEADRLFGQIESFLQHIDRVIVVLYQPLPEWQNYLKQKLARHGWLDKSVRIVVV